MTSPAAFDILASQYDELWSSSPAGLCQRRAVWRQVDLLFNAGEIILDVGCGIGDDALHFMGAGVTVRAIDASPEMVRIANARGVDATVMRIEDLDGLEGSFQGTLSNFGALNCVADLSRIRRPLARVIRPGGFLALCLLGRFCLWEAAWYALQGRPRKAFRRWPGDSYSSSLHLHVFYPTVEHVRKALLPDFHLVRWSGIGLAVPPSYVTGLSPKLFSLLNAIDQRITHLPFLRMLADHRLLVFIRK